MQPQQPDLQALYEKLRESEEKYRRFVENAADIIYRTDGEGRFIYVNPVSLRIFGYAEDEFMGKHYLELFHPNFRNKTRQFYATQFFNGQKTLAGSVCFFITAIVVNAGWLYIGYHLPIGNVLKISLLISLFATIAELVTLHGWDNMTVPAITLLLLNLLL